MLIGQATLKSAAFCPRLTMLLSDLQGAGYTVWLEGLSVRFDRAHGASAPTAAQAAQLGALMRRYRDVVVWLPEPPLELTEVLAEAPAKTDAAPLAPSPRWRPRFFRRTHEAKIPRN
jgi:hypothetical protein